MTYRQLWPGPDIGSDFRALQAWRSGVDARLDRNDAKEYRSNRVNSYWLQGWWDANPLGAKL